MMMKMSSRICALMLCVLLVWVGLTGVAAAAPVDPLVDRVEVKAGQAGEDPVGFVEDHASEEGLANETTWTRDYACFVVAEAAREAGQEPPDVPVCPGFEDAREEDDLGLDDEAVADELGFDPVAEADRLVDDALGTVGQIVDDPTSVLDELLGFLDRTTSALQRILWAVVDFVMDRVTLPAVVGGWMSDAALSGAASLIDGVASAMGLVGDGVSLAWQGLTGALASAVDGAVSVVDGVTEAVSGTMDSLRETVASWFGTEPSLEKEPSGLLEETREVDQEVDSLVDRLDRSLPSI